MNPTNGTTYEIDKKVAIVESEYEEGGENIRQILERLMKSEY